MVKERLRHMHEIERARRCWNTQCAMPPGANHQRERRREVRQQCDVGKV